MVFCHKITKSAAKVVLFFDICKQFRTFLRFYSELFKIGGVGGDFSFHGRSPSTSIRRTCSPLLLAEEAAEEREEDVEGIEELKQKSHVPRSMWFFI